MLSSLLLTLSAPTHAAPAAVPDCALAEEDYAEIRRALKALRRAQAERILVAGSGERCSRAVADVLRNDPLLGANQVLTTDPANAREHVASVARDQGRCAGVVEPARDGWTVVAVGVCEEAQPKENRIVSVGPWLPTGASVRWNENLAGGISLVADVAARFPEAFWDSPEYQVLVGFDLSQGAGQLSGNYLGFRGGMQRTDLWTSPDVPSDIVVQAVVGHKWIKGPTGAQVGGGLQAIVPRYARATQHFQAVVELRFGLASWR